MSYGEQVETLLKQGTQFLGEKQYEKAVQVMGEACAAYQEETGSTDAYLMFLYGKALYESGVSKSDVLGGQEITNNTIESANTHVEESGDANFQFNDLAAEEVEEEEKEEQDAEEEEEDEGVAQEEDSEEENEGEGEGEGEDDEEDKSDLELAWDMLEVSRHLYEDQLKNLSTTAEKPYLKSDKEEPKDEYVKILKQLSEVHDLLGEVSLESEHFIQAAQDLETCLNMRKQLYDPEYSPLVGESHFKLSLALEFCLEDKDAKDKARSHIQDAIKILKNDTARNPDKKTDNEEMIASLQERYEEIDTTAEKAINEQKDAMLQGIFGGSGGAEVLGQVLGGASASNAKPAVNDLTGMVKKRKAKPKDGEKRQKK